MKRYKIRYDSYRLPIATKEYTLAQIEDFLQDQYDEYDWEDKAGARLCRDRRIILYALRVARRSPASSDRRDQLIQLCRKHAFTQPNLWSRFLRERYQYANTRDFFCLDYNDIIWEYYAYDDELSELGADPRGTGRVFDAAPQFKELVKTVQKLSAQMSVKETVKKETKTNENRR